MAKKKSQHFRETFKIPFYKPEVIFWQNYMNSNLDHLSKCKNFRWAPGFEEPNSFLLVYF